MFSDLIKQKLYSYYKKYWKGNLDYWLGTILE